LVSVEDIENISIQIASEYSHAPIRLLEDARSERNLAESEQGRYILELLQNADDAQTKDENSEAKRIGNAEIIFVVKGNYFYCSNGGYPISKEGLNAICRAFLSPKRKSVPVIGFKGIGFKSVLGLCDCPEIYWRDGGVAFSRIKTFEFLKIHAPAAISESSVPDMPLLRCPHNIDITKTFDDEMLKELIPTSATVFRFLLSNETGKANLISRLKEIKPSTMLFINNLKTVTINIEGIIKRFELSKSSINVNRTDSQLETYQATVNDTNCKLNWILIAKNYRLPEEIKLQSSATWKDTDYIRVAFAVEMNAEGKPTPSSDYPFLHVFFPTDERVPFKILLHGTFKTNVDRRLLVLEDPLNDYVTARCIDLLKDVVIPMLSGLVDDAGQILDFIKPPKDLKAQSAEWNLYALLVSALRKEKFLPNRANDGKLTPEQTLLSPLSRDVSTFKSLVKGELSSRFCFDTIDTSEERRETLRIFGANIFEVNDLPDYFEKNFVKETIWISSMYTLLDNITSYLKSTDSNKKDCLIEDLKKRKLLLLTSGEVVTADSANTECAIFFPPTASSPIPPKGLNLRFLDRRVIDEYLRQSNKSARDSFLVSDVGVEEYAAIPVISKSVIPAIRNFWEQWPNALVFQPEEVSEFLTSLLSTDYPTDDKIKSICLLPVPIRNNDKYAPACRTYASIEWTGNNDLEQIYDDKVPFLTAPSSHLTNDILEKTKSLYRWLGVAWLPRILPQFQPFEDNKWRSSYWRSDKTFQSPFSGLSNWNEYCAALNEYGKTLIENPFLKYEALLVTSWRLEGFDEISKNPKRSKQLIAVIAAHWDDYYSEFSKCIIYWRTSMQRYYRSCDVPSFFYWKIQNTAWIPSTKYELWSSKKPVDLFFKTDSIYKELGDLIPYVEVKDEIERAILTKLGVKSGIDDLVADDWWRIAIDIPRLIAADERTVRPLYRKMMQVQGIECKSEKRDNFLLNGKLLALAMGKPEFVARSDVWYVEGEEFRRLFEEQIRIFTIQHEEKKGAAIERTFEINVLEDYLTPLLKIGAEDTAASDLLNKFLSSCKQFIMARVYAQRPSKEMEDIAALKRLSLRIVKSLDISYSLSMDDRVLEVKSQRGTYLQKNSNIIYIDSGKFQMKDLESIEKDTLLASELGMQIAYYLSTDLANDFMFLLGSNYALRCEILNRANISLTDICHFGECLKNEPELKIQPSPTIQAPIDNSPTTVPAPNLTEPTPASIIPNPVPPSTQTLQFRPIELWLPSELGFGELMEKRPEPNTGRNGGNGGGCGGGGGFPGYLTDPDERKKVEQAGVNLVIAFERHRHQTSHGCTPNIVSREKDKCGFDIESVCSAETRFIEVKSSKEDIQSVELSAKEWDVTRDARNRENHYLYRVKYLDKRNKKEPEIVIIQNPYDCLIGEPTRFKVRLNRLQGKFQVMKCSP
jgi:hypothetical protein